MKKLAVLLGLGGMLMLMVSMAQAQSDWAYYKEHPVKVCDVCEEGKVTTEVCLIADGYKGPRMFILDYSTDPDENDCITNYYTLNCCACHGSDAPGNHGGPQFPASQCP